MKYKWKDRNIWLVIFFDFKILYWNAKFLNILLISIKRFISLSFYLKQYWEVSRYSLITSKLKDNNNLIEKGLEMKGDYYKLYLE